MGTRGINEVCHSGISRKWAKTLVKNIIFGRFVKSGVDDHDEANIRGTARAIANMKSKRNIYIYIYSTRNEPQMGEWVTWRDNYLLYFL